MAGSFSQDFIESLRNAGDIVRLVSDYVPLKTAGSRQKGLCPFHEEKTPSFSVDPEPPALSTASAARPAGDVFKFVMLYEKLAFPEAVEFLAKRWGVPCPPEESEEGRAARAAAGTDERGGARLFPVDARGRGPVRCRRYLERRKHRRRRRRRSSVWATRPTRGRPARPPAVAAFQARRDPARRAALPSKSGSGEYDRFRNRLIFPIRDVGSRTVAFGGRAIGDAEPKYINSPETPAYKKGEHLYGLDQAKEAIRKRGVRDRRRGLPRPRRTGRGRLRQRRWPRWARRSPRRRRACSRATAAAWSSPTTETRRGPRRPSVRSTCCCLVASTCASSSCRRDGPRRLHRARRRGGLRPNCLKHAPEYLEFLIRREARKDASNRSRQGRRGQRGPAAPGEAGWRGRARRLGRAARRRAAHRKRPGPAGAAGGRESVSSHASASGRRPSARPRCRGPAGLAAAAVRRRAGALGRAENGTWPIWRGAGFSRSSARSSSWRAKRHPGGLPDRAGSAGTRDSDRDLLTRIAFREEPEEGPTADDCLSAFRRRRLTMESKRLRREIGRSAARDGGPSVNCVCKNSPDSATRCTESNQRDSEDHEQEDQANRR